MHGPGTSTDATNDPPRDHFEVRSLQVGKFENGLMVERWGSTDVLGILTQLGLVTPHRAGAR